MGVRGLTTFIARNSDQYMEDYYLYKCYLIIDGNNLAAQLYKSRAKCYDCFGGDYDIYTQTIIHFFNNLSKCNIKPLIVFDGCYENKKLKTIYLRIKERIKYTRNVSAVTEGSVKVFPLFLRELFTETVLKLGYKCVRCEFEADYEMACMARKLNCPILSFDSDFFIFDVLYVPFNTISFECTPRSVNQTDKHPQLVIECKLYRMDNFLRVVGGMDKSVLPLFAVLVGNDYIKSAVFKDFYANIKFVKRRRTGSEQLRKIESVIKWLLNENYESAAKKILGRIKRVHRQEVADQIEEISRGYICEDSKYLSYFNITLPENTKVSMQRTSSKIDLSTIPEEANASDENAPDDDDEDDDEKIEIPDAPGALVVDSLSPHFPEWFLDNFQSGQFPAWFMDIAVHNRYFFIQQVENYDLEHSHSISLPLLSAMHSILRSTVEDKSKLTYVARGKQCSLTTNLLDTTNNVKVPTLLDIPSMTSEELKKILVLNILEFDASVLETINSFDPQWAIFILSILYWAKNANLSQKINKNHVYSLILSGTILNHVDNLIGYTRSLRDVNRKSKRIRPELVSALNFIKEMIPYFQMDEKMARNPRGQYDIHILHAFALFQSSLFHIKYLNKLLLCPFQDFLVSDFYNGTFIYFIYANLKKRTDSLSYLKGLLKDSEDMFQYFANIAENVVDKFDDLLGECSIKKKKRKSTHKNNTSVEGDCSTKKPVGFNDSNRDLEKSPMDPNNRFSVLGDLY